MSESIFRKKSLDQISSPEQLTDYINVSNPSAWIVLSTILVLLTSALILAVFIKLPTTLTFSAYVTSGESVCYVDEATAGKLKSGDPVKIGNASGTISSVASMPLSKTELRQKYSNDYVFSSLSAGDWNYPVEIRIAGALDGLQKATFTTDSVSPISFLTN